MGVSKTTRMIRKIAGCNKGELFVETKPEDWDQTLAAAVFNPQVNPWPIPVGHHMFTYPLDYDCERVQGYGEFVIPEDSEWQLGVYRLVTKGTGLRIVPGTLHKHVRIVAFIFDPKKTVQEVSFAGAMPFELFEAMYKSGQIERVK